MSKKNAKPKKLDLTFGSSAVNIVSPAVEMKVSAPPPDKWMGIFKVRSTEVHLKSYQEDRDQALVEMVCLLHQQFQDFYGCKVLGLIRL